MARLRIVLLAGVLVVAATGAAVVLGVLGMPAVGGVDNRFAGVNASTTLIQTEVTVSNPNPVGASLGQLTIDYTVTLNDVPIAAGTKEGVAVESGNSTVAFTTAMANEQIPPWWVSHIRNGERTTLRVHTNVTSGLLGRSIEVTPVERPIDTDILSAFNSTETRPVNADSPLVSDPVLYVNETSAAWGDVSASSTPIEMAFVVYNPKAVPYAITEIGYTISMNDIQVGEGRTAREYALPPHTERTIEATTEIRNQRLDEWWVSHLQNDQVTTLRIEFNATVELPNGQRIEVPLDQLTYTETIETDFFGNKADDAPESVGDDGTADDGATATATAAADTRSETRTGDRTTDGTPSSVSPTPSSPTPTPDDGLLENETSTGIL